jgi:hypothetical protein
MKSGEERSTLGDLSEYARETVHAVEPPYFARIIEDVPTTLTTAIGNLFEALLDGSRAR